MSLWRTGQIFSIDSSWIQLNPFAAFYNNDILWKILIPTKSHIAVAKSG
jgi:hypothetical protein